MTSPTGPLGRKARTRAAILDAAGDLFARNGIESTPVELIAETAGVSVGALYSHFGSKQGIVLAYVSASLDIVEAMMEEARKEPTPLARVYAAGDAYFRFAVEHPAACRFATIRVLQPDPDEGNAEQGNTMSRRAEAIVLEIAKDVKLAMDEGQIAPAPIDETMVFLWGLWNGVTALTLRQNGSAIPPELAARALQLARTTMGLATRQVLQLNRDREAFVPCEPAAVPDPPANP